MVNAIPVLMATAATLAACSTKQDEAPKAATTAPARAGEKIVPSPWQPPAEVDPPHRNPGDRVEPDPGKNPPPPTAPPPKTPS